MYVWHACVRFARWNSPPKLFTTPCATVESKPFLSNFELLRSVTLHLQVSNSARMVVLLAVVAAVLLISAPFATAAVAAFDSNERVVEDSVEVRGSRPNIVIFYADDLGSGDIGFYGHPTSFTPNLDTFLTEGARLTQYYSPAAICSPSRGSLMTGRLFPRLGIWPGVLSPLSKGGLPLSEKTIARALKDAGYVTGAFGGAASGCCAQLHGEVGRFSPCLCACMCVGYFDVLASSLSIIRWAG